MSGEARAQAARDRGEHGYYVRNMETRLIVAGPFDRHGDAQREANERNAHPPITDVLEVVLVGPDRVWP